MKINVIIIANFSLAFLRLGGSVEEISLKSISIPINLDYGETTLLEHIQVGTHQKFHGNLLSLENKQSILDKISAILKNRDCESDIPKWVEFISDFPDEPEFNLGAAYINIFDDIASGYGGAIQVTTLLAA